MSNEFFIWEGVFQDFYSAKKFADGFGFSGETYNTRALDAAKECLSSLEKKEPIPFFHKQRSVLLPPIAAMMLKQQKKIDILDFGGGLGIGYMTLKESITNTKQKINYTILELPEICIQGRDLHKEEIDFLGARVSFGSESFYASSLSRYFPRVLEMSIDAAINPNFLEEEFFFAKNSIELKDFQ